MHLGAGKTAERLGRKRHTNVPELARRRLRFGIGQRVARANPFHHFAEGEFRLIGADRDMAMAFLHDGVVWIPYGIDDCRIGVAYAPLGAVLAELSSAS